MKWLRPPELVLIGHRSTSIGLVFLDEVQIWPKKKKTIKIPIFISKVDGIEWNKINMDEIRWQMNGNTILIVADFAALINVEI